MTVKPPSPEAPDNLSVDVGKNVPEQPGWVLLK